MHMNSKSDKELLVYHKTEMGYVAHSVNIRGAVTQGKTLEELKANAKDACKCMLSFMTKVIDQDDPFELEEETNLDVYFHGKEGVDLRRELQRYKDIFGELPSEI